MPHIAECFPDLVYRMLSQQGFHPCENMVADGAPAHKQTEQLDDNDKNRRQRKGGEKRRGGGHPQRVVLAKLAESCR